MTAFQKWDEPRPVKLTIADFLCLNDAGAFRDYPKTELIDGVVVAMNAQFSTHARVKTRILRRVADAVDRTMPGYEAWVEVSTAIPPVSLPEPDIVVTRFQAAGRSPVPVETIALIVEVADTTRSYDLGAKARLYASASVPEYWVVDVERQAVQQLWSPAGEAFAEQRTVAFGEPLAAMTIEGLIVETKGL